jgi:hypothetical protein
MCVTLLLCCHAKMNNFMKADQAVDKSWVALFLSTALSLVAFHLSITH